MWQRFFERHGIGPMANDGHHGEGEHDQRDMPVPAMPGVGFVVIEAEFVFGGFETVLDGLSSRPRAGNLPDGKTTMLTMENYRRERGRTNPHCLCEFHTPIGRPTRSKPRSATPPILAVIHTAPHHGAV